MRPKLRLALNMPGSGLQLSLRKGKSSSLTYLLGETCLLCGAVYCIFARFIRQAPSFNRRGGTWYPQACKFLKVEHHIHSPYEKSVIERTIQYVKDRIECFDDYFPCKKNNCKLKHVKQWLGLFVDQHNKETVC